MKIAIIGGSIAGCALAVLLKNKFDVTIYERSKDLQSRGAGITITNELLQKLVSLDILDQETLAYSFSSRSFYCNLPQPTDSGTCIWTQNISIASLHWDTLYTNLRKRIPDEIYKKGQQVVDVQFTADLGRITLNSGYSEEFDLIVFADGHQSMGRTLISENSHLTYSGYVAWRGVLDFDLIQDKTTFIDNIPYYCFETGHLLAYAVNHNGTKKLNWVFYEKLTPDALDELGNTSLIDFSNGAKDHLYQLADDKLPKDIAQIIKDTPAPFMQKIVDVGVKQFAMKRAVLLGDASVVLRPHVGSGASLAIQDALNLSDNLSEYELHQALDVWGTSTLANRLPIYELSQRMGDALVLNPVLWSSMDTEKMNQWWGKILRGEPWYTTEDEKTSLPHAPGM